MYHLRKTRASPPLTAASTEPVESARLGSAHCWERGLYSRPGPEGRYTSISTSFNTCGLRENGSAVCWVGGLIQADSPPEDHYFKAISVGDSHICALRDDGAPICWEWYHYDPTILTEDGRFTGISAGYRHVCALREDGTPVCWDYPEYDQGLIPEGRKLRCHQQRRFAHLRTPPRWHPRLLEITRPARLAAAPGG